MLDRVLGQQTGVIRGAAGHHEHFVDLAQLLVAQALLVEHDPAVLEVPQQCLGHRGGLLGDLFEHEVLVAALFGGRQVPVDVKTPGVGGVIVTGEIGDAVAVGGDDHRLVLAKLDSFASERDERRHIRAQEHLAVADADHQRRGPTRRHDGARFVGVGEHHSEVALQPAEHCQRRGHEVPGGVALAVLTGQQVDGHLAVGLAGELHPGAFQFVAQHREVLDDAVVHHGELAVRVAVRVGVVVGGTAMGGPAGVAQPGPPGQQGRIRGGQFGFQVGQPAGTAPDGQLPDPVDDGDSRGVIAAVLHATQGLDDDVASRALPDVADDSTHSCSG